MASFPDLRPHRRSAKAERSAASKNRVRLLFAVSAALLLTASLAVTELATLRGAKAHDATAFLTRELGPPLDSAPLVREPARGVTVRIRPRGFAVKSPAGSVGLASHDVPSSSWTHFTHGVSRRTNFGRESVVVAGRKTEQFFTVEQHQGLRTWRWAIDSKLMPRMGGDGAVVLGDGATSFQILPVAVLDTSGRNVTPHGARWQIARAGGAWQLQLRLDDAKLSLPYVIDPAVTTFRNGQGGNNGTGATATLTINKPAGVVQNDFLIAQVTIRGGTNIGAITAPAGWTVCARSPRRSAPKPGRSTSPTPRACGRSPPASPRCTCWSTTPVRRSGSTASRSRPTDRGRRCGRSTCSACCA